MSAVHLLPRSSKGMEMSNCQAGLCKSNMTSAGVLNTASLTVLVIIYDLSGCWPFEICQNS